MVAFPTVVHQRFEVHIGNHEALPTITQTPVESTPHSVCEGKVTERKVGHARAHSLQSPNSSFAVECGMVPATVTVVGERSKCFSL